VQHIHDELQCHGNQNRSPVACSTALAVESLLERITFDYRRNTRRFPVHPTAVRLKESA